jgi:enoyl-CoA hydratase/carnithine racemase
LPPIARTIGWPRAMEMALTGRTVSADDAREWGLVNLVTEDYPVNGEVMKRPVVKKARSMLRRFVPILRIVSS